MNNAVVIGYLCISLQGVFIILVVCLKNSGNNEPGRNVVGKS